MNITLKQVEQLAQNYTVIPVVKTLFADTETPVSLWLKLCSQRPYAFLLESVEGDIDTGRYSVLGSEPFALFTATGRNWEVSAKQAPSQQSSGTGDPVGALRSFLKQFTQAPTSQVEKFCGGAVGFFGYDSIRLIEAIPDENPKDDPLADIMFGFYQNLAVFDKKEQKVHLVSNILTEYEPDLPRAYNQAHKAIEQMQQQLQQNLPQLHRTPCVQMLGEITSNVSRNYFEKSVEKAKEFIKAGDIFQVVLSQRFQAEVQASAIDLYRVLRTVNPSPYMFLFQTEQSAIIGASPEMLVRAEGPHLQTRPIAGTRHRGASSEEDQALARELLQDPKERAEHVMLVDLGRNDLGRVSAYGSVKVEHPMHIERYSHVMHIVSNVVSISRPDVDALDALYAVFPAGTLSGAPKIRAMEIIDELETVKRSCYGGALGYIGFDGNLDTCIVIRTIHLVDTKAFIQVGAGIVADSDPAKEYEETVHKANALFSALTHNNGDKNL